MDILRRSSVSSLRSVPALLYGPSVTGHPVKPLLLLGALLASLVVSTTGFAVTIDDPAIQRSWERADKPVADDRASRTWIWGPEPYSSSMWEPYSESPRGTRLVQYFDKSRMEITAPDAFDDGLWYVTNGLLVVEMVQGRFQIGNETFDESPAPAGIPIAGDPGSASPTYADIDHYRLTDTPPLMVGSLITQRIDGDGNVSNDSSKSAQNITAAQRFQAPKIDHTVASVFWEFMTSTGVVYENGRFITESVFENPFYATGYPITEAFWSAVMVNNEERDVLWQCFERRCLTYTPGNPTGFLVESGNVGQHYYRWRYQDAAILVGAGDIASCEWDEDEATAALLDTIQGTVMALGDNNQDEGTADQFATCYDPSWGRHKERTRPVPGNREYRTAGAEPYFDYFGSVAGERGKGYYSYDLNRYWHVIALNSKCSEVGGCIVGSPQYEWLQQDLEAHRDMNVVVYWHLPRYSSGVHGGSDTVTAFWNLLYEYGAELVISSDDHDYERFAPMDVDGNRDDARGLRQFVVGTGGAPLRDFLSVQPNSEARNSDSHGVLQLRLYPDRYEWEFIPVVGRSFTDSGSSPTH